MHQLCICGGLHGSLARQRDMKLWFLQMVSCCCFIWVVSLMFCSCVGKCVVPGHSDVSGRCGETWGSLWSLWRTAASCSVAAPLMWLHAKCSLGLWPLCIILRAAPFQRGLINVPQVGTLGDWCTPCRDLVEIPKELEVNSPQEDNVFPGGRLIPE